jgi:hypothetical protein
MDKNKKAALGYAEHLKWAIFPLHSITHKGGCTCGKPECSSPGKHPRTRHGVKDATTDHEIICSWWDKWPDANIGIATGEVSGFDVLDIDPRHDGDTALRKIEKIHGNLPSTPEQLTGGGGRHILFRHQDGITNSTGKLPEGIDVRGDGGYIVGAPSQHASGRAYTWECEALPREVPLADMPEWLLSLIRSKDEGRGRHTPFEAELIPEGRRNTSLASLAGMLRNKGMAENEIAAALYEKNQRCCTPPLPHDEVKKIATSISQYPTSSLFRCKLEGTKYKLNDQKSTDQPVDQLAPPIGGEREQTGQYHRLTASALRADYRPTQWLIDQIAPQPGLVLMAGSPGIGKTWLVLSQALAVATGTPWLNRLKTRQGPVLLVLEEEDSSAVIERLNLLYAGMGLSQQEGDDLPIEFLIQQGVNLTTADGYLDAELLRHIQDVQPIMIVLDPFRRVHGLEENDSATMSHLFSLLRRLTKTTETPCTIFLIHHLRKRSEHSADSLDRLRGSSDIPASADSILEVGGEFGHNTILHSKSKRGISLGAFLAQGEMNEEAVSLCYIDSAIKAEIDRKDSKTFILEQLTSAKMNQSKLLKNGQLRGFGRKRLEAAINELVGEKVITETRGPRNSKIYSLSDQSSPSSAPHAQKTR